MKLLLHKHLKYIDSSIIFSHLVVSGFLGYGMENLKRWIWPLEGSSFSQEYKRNLFYSIETFNGKLGSIDNKNKNVKA